jgi:hypothetical protein
MSSSLGCRSSCEGGAESSGSESAGEDEHDGHEHRKLLQTATEESGHHDDHGGAEEASPQEEHEDEHAAEHEDEHTSGDSVQRVLTAESLVAPGNNSTGSLPVIHSHAQATPWMVLHVHLLVAVLPLQSGAVRANVARALAFITACQADPSCELEAGHMDEAEIEVANSKAHLGLKSALALSFVPMTIIASFFPTLFMRSPSYHVRNAPCMQSAVMLLELHELCELCIGL